METKVNHQWRLVARPSGKIKESDFQWREEPVPTLAEGQLLVRNIYLSIDPTNRVWVRETASYLPPVQLGEVMRGVVIGVVEESRHAKYQVGDLVQGTLGWQEYAVTDGTGLLIMISQYNATEPVPGPYNFGRALTQRARVEGFIVLDYLGRAEEDVADLARWLAESKIQYRVDVVDGLELAPAALNKLFDGTNKGKLIVQVSEEPSL